MDPTFDAFLRSWPLDPWMLFALLITAGLYLRGWLVLRERDGSRWPAGRVVAFGMGLLTVFLALCSPIETFTSLLLQVHMLQHLLLMMIAPPLLWLGAPAFPMLLGLPRPVRTYWIAPFFRSRIVRQAFRWLTHPVPAWLLFTAATWIWHVPPTYELALSSDGWHYLQHISFLVTALIFWYPVIRPFPSHPRWSPWLLVPYLILADVQNTLLAAWLTFSTRPLYAYYVNRPRLGNLSPLEDQAAAGVLMWVPGSLVYLVPLFVIGIRLLFGSYEKRGGFKKGSGSVAGTARRVLCTTVPDPFLGPPAHAVSPARLALPIIGQPVPRAQPVAFDLLHVPLLGRFLRWKHARACLQLPLVILAGFVVFDGFFGPPIAAMNLAGVLPWIHWRGLVVLGLLASGNVFCMACPFMLPRTLARRYRTATYAWPSWLRNKWPAVFLVVVFLWAYEAFALWDSPWLTAAIVVAFFALAFLIDGLFRGASFCKYVCPIGQFNFVQSLVSPLEIKALAPDVCSSCRSKDCIKGRDDIPGCELGLFQPRKSSNMDCTFCLDCIHACPHQNIGIVASAPAAALWNDPRRSGIGRFSRRIDLAALCVVLVFGAFANAALMTGPLLDVQDRIMLASGLDSHFLATTALCLIALIGLPLFSVASVAVLSRRWGRLPQTPVEVGARYAYALIPLGFGMWLAHYSFHFLTGYESVVPTAQRFFADRGWTIFGSPDWSCAACVPAPFWLLRLEILFLDLGLLLSLYTGYRTALSQTERLPQTLKAFAPWAILMLSLFAAGIWIVFQPMQMRGMMQMAR
jgi:cytochrome c oxidase assembly factor CtaG/ferredoxin